VCVLGAVDSGNFGLFQKRPRLAPKAVGCKTLESEKASCKSDWTTSRRTAESVAQRLAQFFQIALSINTSRPVAPCSYNARNATAPHYAVPEAMARQKGEN